MSSFNNVLAVLGSDAQAPKLLGKLQSLSAPDADISLIRVVYEGLADLKSKHIDASTQLKDLVLSAERDALNEVVSKTGATINNLTCSVVWNSRNWEGVVHAADAENSQLIVKTTDDDNGSRLRTPDDWNLLRNSSIPVLLTQPRTWAKSPTVVVALDIYDPDHNELNERIMATAHDFCNQIGGDLHLVSVFPALSVWLDEVTTVQSYQKLRSEIESEIFDGLATLAAEHSVAKYTGHAMEGLAANAMQRLCGSLGADIVVIGTKARKGVAGLLLGNTAEKLLHELSCDVLTVP